MFSLREVEDDKFIYRCHQCGWESEIMTNEQAVTYSRLHKCAPKSASPVVQESPKASYFPSQKCAF
jgi:peptide subunit release factor 1 (eRF1)